MSNRQSVLVAIHKAGTATCAEIDDLSGLGVTKVRFTIGDLKKASLIYTTKDDITGQPAYKLTPSGLQWLKDHDASIDEPEAANAQQAFADASGQAMAALREKLKLAEQQRDEHFAEAEAAQKALADLQDDIRRQTQRAVAAEANRDDLKKLLDDVSESSSADMRLIEELNSQIETKDRIIESMSEQLEGKPVDASLPGESVDVKDAAIGYLIRVKGKRPLIRSKPEGAHAAAMSSAKAHGRADVLALVPVGKAVRGATWKDAA